MALVVDPAPPALPPKHHPGALGDVVCLLRLRDGGFEEADEEGERVLVHGILDWIHVS